MLSRSANIGFSDSNHMVVPERRRVSKIVTELQKKEQESINRGMPSIPRVRRPSMR